MQNVRAIIFDLDDTLYPQIEYTRECLMATVDYISEISGCEKGIISQKLNGILDKNGIEYKFIFNDLFRMINFDGMSYIKDILKYFWDCKPEIKLYDGVENVLEVLSEKFKLSVLTDGYVEVQKYKINQLGIEKYFEKILITDFFGVEFRKPSSVCFKKLLEDLNLLASECVYVGNDPRKDFLPAREVGMKTIRIRQGDYKNLTLDKTLEADIEIDDIKYLLNIMDL